MKEKDILLKLLDGASSGGIIPGHKMDDIMMGCWEGKAYDAKMHCNSMMRRGLLDYLGDGDYEILVSRQEVEASE